MFVPQKAVLVGDGSLLIQCAEIWLQAGNTVVAVASEDASILAWAAARALACERFEAELKLPGVEFDYLFSIANLRVLPQAVLSRARSMAVNFHDGPLPRYAGLHATSWALMAGETRHGVTWHEMTPRVDAGRIVRQALFDIGPDETALGLNARCYEAGLDAFRAIVRDLGDGTLALQPQQGESSYFARHRKPAALATLDLHAPASRLCALVRGLDLGGYANPIALPKLWLGDRVALVGGAEPVVAEAGHAPGTVLAAGPGTLTVAVADGALALTGLRSLADAVVLDGIRVGSVLPALPADTAARLAERTPALAKGETFWRHALSTLTRQQLPVPVSAGESGSARLDVTAGGHVLVAGFATWLAALGGFQRVSLLYADAGLRGQAAGIEPWVSACLPLDLEVNPAWEVRQACARVEARVAQARQAGPMVRDLPWRLGDGDAGPAWPSVAVLQGRMPVPAGVELALCERAPGEVELVASGLAAPVVQELARQLQAWLQRFGRGEGTLSSLGLLPEHDRQALDRLNGTEVALPDLGGVVEAIALASRRAPGQEALRWHGQALSHEVLQQRSDALAASLQARGVAPGDVVGLCLERTPELVVAVLAVLKAGAAYLPLDPDYPADRLRFMLEDSQTRLVLCSPATRALLALPPGQALDPASAGQAAHAPPLPQARPDAAAYVIYTSGSTGRPKGVVVTHANVLNFFAGMDAQVPHQGGGRWLAVTSLSFDISVLELLWTLSRGFTVVLHSNVAPASAAKAPEFSLFYFAADETAAPQDRYRLLMEGARFGDREGFTAVWTPERHFHAFGGLYPNPAVASAAIAAATTRIQIRAGSCVLPLHHPVRVAEDWALVDNISNGRVGISFAAGWQPNDFVLAPQNFADRKNLMLEHVATVRRLWRGETLSFPGAQGKDVAVRTLPRPVQAELPVWLTAAGNPETFEQAGAMGCRLLTHLLGQRVEDVAAKIALYRAAWRKAGHPGHGHATLMLHTFVGSDEDAVRETARGPMKAYLRSSVDLIRQAAWSFPTFVQRGAQDGRTPLEVMDAQPLSDADMDALLDHAFNRYWGTSALIGTPERCLSMVQQLQDAGVDEIACLIDFGIAPDTVLTHLHDLARLKDLAARPRRVAGKAQVGAELVAEGITHLQCTPSMATMLVADGAGRAGLGRLQALLVGGEALPLPLARELRALVPGKLLNMYGPTETTVWSTCCDLDAIGDFVPLGWPIANTTLQVRNAWGGECPALLPGELLIGGAGVARGYLHRPELTAERFIDDPARPGQRLYRTGDLVRRHPDGRLEFLGRMDHQVKVRGHRIELGEIEATLLAQPGVREAVVLARQDSADETFLLGYVTARPGAAVPDAEQLRRALALALPDIMVPKAVLVLPAFPLTPNGKLDRKALADARPFVAAARPAATPANPLEQSIAAIWSEVLGVPEVGRDSNFFDLGGHSLLVVQVQRRLREASGHEVSITDMFRLPTVAAIAAHLAGEDTGGAAISDGLNRAQARRAMRQRPGTRAAA